MIADGRTLLFVRHGETDWNAEGRLQGGRDVPLNRIGLAQAEEAGRRLRDLHPDPAALDYVASPLERTRVTMERCRAALGLEPGAYRLDDRLREIGFGTWEGMTWREIRRADPGRARARDADRWSYRPPGEAGESYPMLAERVAPALAALDRDAVMVAHGGVARAIFVLQGCVTEAQAPTFEVRQGRVLVIRGREWRWA